MRDLRGFARLSLAISAALSVAAPGAARADVTIEERSTYDFTLLKGHGTITELTSTDKQRRDSDMHCEGFMSMLCGNVQTGEIIRLDRDVQWALEPAKKQYRESHIPTAAERQAAEQQAQAMLEQMKSCPAAAPPASSAPDTSKCEMSPPKIDVKPTDQHATFAGHEAKLTQVALTQSCKMKDTGDVCDFVFTLDSWLTQDQIAGIDDREAFRKAYAHKLGLDNPSSAERAQMRQFLAPYADSMKQLGSKAADLKGYPLKTAFRVSFGGEHCAAAAKAAQSAGPGGSVAGNAGQAAGAAAASSAAGAAGAEASSAAAKAAGNSAAGSALGSAAGELGSKLVGGLFGKKKPQQAAATPAGAASQNMVQAAEFTVETASITSGAIAPTQFDIPAGWKLVPPKEKETKPFSCPKSGS